MNKLKKTHPEIIVKKEQRKPVYYHSTETIQRLLKEGKTITEICEIVNLKESSVKNNIYRFEKRNGTYVNKVKNKTAKKV